MKVSKNGGTPKSSILIGFSIINHPFVDIPILGNLHSFKFVCLFSWGHKETIGNPWLLASGFEWFRSGVIFPSLGHDEPVRSLELGTSCEFSQSVSTALELNNPQMVRTKSTFLFHVVCRTKPSETQ